MCQCVSDITLAEAIGVAMAYDRLDVSLLSLCVKLSTWNRALPSPGHGVSRVIAWSCLFVLICILQSSPDR